MKSAQQKIKCEKLEVKKEGVVGHRRHALAVGRPVRVRGPRDRVVVEGRRADDGVEARDEADVVGLRQCLVDGDHRPQVPRQPLVARVARQPPARQSSCP